MWDLAYKSALILSPRSKRDLMTARMEHKSAAKKGRGRGPGSRARSMPRSSPKNQQSDGGGYSFRGIDSIELAASVVRASDRAKPADAVLRAALKGQPGPSRTQSTEVTRMVFAFYRWFGWLDRSKPIHQQIGHALELAERFDRHPEGFADSELMARAVPD